MNNNETILKVFGISKRFPGVQALKDVQFELKKGEVHAVMGENGAGKSTLMKILLGIYIPNTGEMVFKGEKYEPRSPSDALSKGIAMIHQEISLVPTMTVAENIWIGREDKFTKLGIIDRNKLRRATSKILTQLGVQINPDIEVSKLNVANMQLVEIARAVSYDADIVIMDEPTSALTNTEIEKLYRIIRDMVSHGKSVIFISHKLDEVYSICNTITVLRDGQYIDTKSINGITGNQLVNLMVGRELKNMYPKDVFPIGEPVFEVKRLTRKGVFEDISFSVRSGEILGFSGLMGAGRTEIMQAIFGIDKYDSGSLYLHGKEISVKAAKDAIRNRIAMVTEDRHRSGLVQMLSVKSNISLAYLGMITKIGFINRQKEQKDCESMVDAMSIKVASVDNEVSILSGGNQQKAIIGKWLLTEPEVLILDEPTRGIDIGAKTEIYKLMNEMAKEGKAIIMISSELPEIMGVCDRIIVVREGRIVAEHVRGDFSQETIMSSAFGINKD